MKLAISLATRNRPQQLIDTIQRSIVNWVEPYTEMWVMADVDDRPTVEAVIALTQTHPRVKLDVREREDTIADKWNRVLELVPDADLYLVAADDDPYVTPGYDAKLIEAAERLPGGFGMVYGHMANLNFSGVVAPTKKLVQKLGHIFPTFFPYWFCDHWVDDIVRIVGCISFADVKTDQTNAGKTQEMREVGWWATWFDAAYLRRREIAQSIILSSEMNLPAWQRETQLHLMHPVIEFRSRALSDFLRANARTYDSWSGLGPADERYQRVKQRAIDLVPELLQGLTPAEQTHYRNILAPPTNVVGLARAWA